MNSLKKRCYSYLLVLAFMTLVPQVKAQELNCPSYLTPQMLAEVFGDRVSGIQIQATNLEKENLCNRTISIGKVDHFSDLLVFIVSTSQSHEGAQRTLKFMAKGHEADFYYGWPENIGDLCFRYLQPNLLSSHRTEMNVSFVYKNLLVELKYFNVDDGKNNKFVYQVSELEALAKMIVENLP
ncbi:hypothetical protein [Pararhodonellum marinum]|uniref:hypothetical protein n=1 Tax=Pararhodonellum marinum TaxID=2755358 RepID=UPI0018903154|nr:hypothetical protein [Pararhodonellum marinum]